MNDRDSIIKSIIDSIRRRTSKMYDANAIQPGSSNKTRATEVQVTATENDIGTNIPAEYFNSELVRETQLN